MDLGMKIQKFIERGQEKGRGAAGKIEGEITSITNQIKDLDDKRRVVEMLPLTRQAVLEICKKGLNEGCQEKFVKGVLLRHLKAVQLRQMNFLWEVVLRGDMSNPNIIGDWLFAILNDQLLEQAVRELPDIGITEADRKKRIDSIDREISSLEERLEKLLS
jgi:hypothetical protein